MTSQGHLSDVTSSVRHCVAAHLKICVVPREELTASQAPSRLKLRSRMNVGVTPRANLYRCTAQARGRAEPLHRPLPVPCHGQMWKMCTLWPCKDAVTSSVPLGSNCRASKGLVCARKCATSWRLTVSLTMTVPTSCASVAASWPPVFTVKWSIA